MSDRYDIRRLGIPGGSNFPFLMTAPDGEETIVYASGFMTALYIYSTKINGSPWSIRRMSDNE
jgi:hypothetical protein